MRSRIVISLIILILIDCSTETKKQAPLFTNLGTLDYPVTTRFELAQKCFNQGLILAYGFNHEESFCI